MDEPAATVIRRPGGARARASRTRDAGSMLLAGGLVALVLGVNGLVPLLLLGVLLVVAGLQRIAAWAVAEGVATGLAMDREAREQSGRLD
jgi:hypothetical protein